MISKVKKIINIVISYIRTSIERFPETIILASIMVIIGIVLNHSNTYEENLTKVLLVIALGVPTSACLKLIYERFEFRKLFLYGIDVLLILLGIAIYFLLPEKLDNQFTIRYISASLCLYLLFTIIPYFYKRKYYSIYCVQLFVSFVITYLYTFVLYLGLMALVFSVNSLFDLYMNEIIYFDLLLIAIGIFGVIFFLGQMPRRDNSISTKNYPKVLKVLFMYIVIPLQLAYTVVLYAYFIRILIKWQWPQGIIGHLVLWYGIVSVLLLFVVAKIGNENYYLSKYKRYFPYIFLVPLIMFFITITIRINAFSFTLFRYYVLAYGIWFLLTMGYHIFKVKSKNMLTIITAMVLIVLSAFGPINGFRISFASQNNRLEALLEKYNMIEHNKIIARKDLDKTEQKNIINIIKYFDRYDALDEISVFPKDFKLENMDELLGFQYNKYIRDDREYITYHYNSYNKMMDISNVDYIARFLVENYNNKSVVIDKKPINVSISLIDDKIEIKKENRVLISKYITDIIGELSIELYTDEKRLGKQLVYNVENEYVEFTIGFINIQGEIGNDNKVLINNLEGNLLINVK